MQAQQLNRFLRIRDLPQVTGLRRTTIGHLIKEGEFPKPIPLTDNGRAVAWLESDIIAWQNRRIAKASAEQA